MVESAPSRAKVRRMLLFCVVIALFALLAACSSEGSEASESVGTDADAVAESSEDAGADAGLGADASPGTDAAPEPEPAPEPDPAAEPTTPYEPPVPSDTVHISCVGDSITYGLGLADRDAECWVFLLPSKLSEKTTTANYGVSGSCVLADGYLPWQGTSEAHRFWMSEENIVIIMLGTNDVSDGAWDAAAYERDYRALVEDVMAKGNSPRVILMTPPVLYANPELDARLADEAIPAIERIAEQTGADVIDLHAATAGHPEWFDDGVHPNAAGHAAIADTIASAL